MRLDARALSALAYGTRGPGELSRSGGMVKGALPDGTGVLMGGGLDDDPIGNTVLKQRIDCLPRTEYEVTVYAKHDVAAMSDYYGAFAIVGNITSSAYNPQTGMTSYTGDFTELFNLGAGSSSWTAYTRLFKSNEEGWFEVVLGVGATVTGEASFDAILVRDCYYHIKMSHNYRVRMSHGRGGGQITVEVKGGDAVEVGGMRFTIGERGDEAVAVVDADVAGEEFAYFDGGLGVGGAGGVGWYLEDAAADGDGIIGFDDALFFKGAHGFEVEVGRQGTPGGVIASWSVPRRGAGIGIAWDGEYIW